MGPDQLPLDIYTTIFYFLDPLDIIALSQVCSSSRMASQERSVWTAALKRCSVENHIPPATFKLNDMSLDELKHASAAPSLVLSKICKGLPMDSEGYAVTLPSRTMHVLYLDPKWDYTRVCLIPGGRFLLAYSTRGDLILYDLKISQPVAKARAPLHMEYEDDYSFTPCPSPDGKEIRVLMTRTLPASLGAVVVSQRRRVEIKVFRFDLDRQGGELWSPDADSMTVTAWESSFGQRPYTISGDLVLFVDHVEHHIYLGVWNYIENTFARWMIPVERYREIFVDRQYVVLVSSAALLYWKIPTLVPQPKHHLDGVIQAPPQAFRVPHASPFHQGRGTAHFYCARLFDWYNTLDRLSSFDFVTETLDDETFTEYTLPLYEPLSADQPPQYRVSKFVKPKDHDRQRYDPVSVSPYAICNGWTVKTFMENGKVYVTASTGTTGGEGTMAPDPMVRLLLPEGFDAVDPRTPLSRKHFNFDPMSGRLAYLSDESARIVVVDYLTYCNPK